MAVAGIPGLGLSLGPSLGLNFPSAALQGLGAGAGAKALEAASGAQSSNAVTQASVSNQGLYQILGGSDGNALGSGSVSQFSATSTLLMTLMDEARKRNKPDDITQAIFALTAYRSLEGIFSSATPTDVVQPIGLIGTA